MGFYIPESGIVSPDTQKKFFRDLYYLMFFFGLADDEMKASKEVLLDELCKLKLWKRFSREKIERAIKKSMTAYFVVDQYYIRATEEGMKNYRIRE